MALEEIAISALLAGTATSAAGSVMAGNEKSAAADFEREQYHVQEQQTKTAAQQDEAARAERN